MSSSTIQAVTTYLDDLLESTKYKDASINGLQIEASDRPIKHIAFAVDCGLSVIEQATSLKADLLVVHHGLWWQSVQPIVGPLAAKLRLCFNKGLSIYASHLPLDGHPTLGNAAQLAEFLQLQNLRGFFEHGDRTIGVSGVFPKPVPIQDVAARLGMCVGSVHPPLVLEFGKREIGSAAIVTGSGSIALEACARAPFDLLISGEPKHEVYHRAKELACSAIFAGHYVTETFGVRALQRVLAETFRVETSWIDEPTGI